MRLFGWIDRVEGRYGVATRFAHIYGIPLVPTRTVLVDLESMEVDRGREPGFLGRRVERTQYRSIPLPLSGRSILAAYLSTFGALGLITVASGWLGWKLGFGTAMLAFGGLAIVAGTVLRLFLHLRTADRLSVPGVGIIAGYALYPVIPTTVLFAIAGGGVLGCAIAWMWSTASPSRAAELARVLDVKPPPAAAKPRSSVPAMKVVRATAPARAPISPPSPRPSYAPAAAPPSSSSANGADGPQLLR